MRFLVMSLAVTLAGCASRESPIPLNSFQTVVAEQPSSPLPNVPEDYLITPMDQLRIDVFGEPDLSLRDLPVDPNGRIALPLAGTVGAEGRTAAQLSQEIAGALRRYIREPQVAVNVTQFNSRKITVEGAVRASGVFPAMHQMTLMDAIALGQGVGDYSKLDEIIVFRRQGGQRYIARFDLRSIQEGRAADPTIVPGDVVVVGFSEARRRFADTIAVLPAAIGIFIALLPRF